MALSDELAVYRRWSERNPPPSPIPSELLDLPAAFEIPAATIEILNSAAEALNTLDEETDEQTIISYATTLLPPPNFWVQPPLLQAGPRQLTVYVAREDGYGCDVGINLNLSPRSGAATIANGFLGNYVRGPADCPRPIGTNDFVIETVFPRSPSLIDSSSYVQDVQDLWHRLDQSPSGTVAPLRDLEMAVDSPIEMAVDSPRPSLLQKFVDLLDKTTFNGPALYSKIEETITGKLGISPNNLSIDLHKGEVTLSLFNHSITYNYETKEVLHECGPHAAYLKQMAKEAALATPWISVEERIQQVLTGPNSTPADRLRAAQDQNISLAVMEYSVQEYDRVADIIKATLTSAPVESHGDLLMIVHDLLLLTDNNFTYLRQETEEEYIYATQWIYNDHSVATKNINISKGKITVDCEGLPLTMALI